jgi:hypothetical protein
LPSFVTPRSLCGALLVAAVACEAAPAKDCGGQCGPGTACVEDRCVPVAPEAAPAPEKPKKSKKKRRRVRRTGSAGAGAPEPAGGAAADPAPDDAPEPSEPPPPFRAVDDRSIPEFSNKEAQTIDLNAGSERPSERVLDQHFARVTPKISDCVVTASRYGDVGSGRLAVKLRILGSGKVESVSVKAPKALDVWGIVPCARKAVYDHRFPSFDGPAVGVDFAVDVD